MSYVLELDATPADRATVELLVASTEAPGFVSLVPARRRQPWDRRPRVFFDARQADAVLDDRASLTQEQFTLSDHRDALARTAILLAAELSCEWTLRSCWYGDRARAEVPVSSFEVVDLIRDSALRRDTVYRVSPTCGPLESLSETFTALRSIECSLPPFLVRDVELDLTGPAAGVLRWRTCARWSEQTATYVRAAWTNGGCVLCDVAREDTSLILDDLRRLGVTEHGSIAIERVELADSRQAREAVLAAPGEEADAVVWETVEARSAEDSRLSWSYMSFMALAAVIAISGLLTDSAILIVGAMVVSPDFGPLAALCVGLTLRRRRLVRDALLATLVGLAIAVVVAAAVAEAVSVLDLVPDAFDFDTGLSTIVANPDAFTVIVALAAGAAGMLSLLTAKSGALVGVLISVTTIPASAQIALSIAFREWSSATGAGLQLASNVLLVVVAGVATLLVHRAAYRRRQHRHRNG